MGLDREGGYDGNEGRRPHGKERKRKGKGPSSDEPEKGVEGSTKTVYTG